MIEGDLLVTKDNNYFGIYIGIVADVYTIRGISTDDEVWHGDCEYRDLISLMGEWRRYV